jgi:hypothetical protein
MKMLPLHKPSGPTLEDLAIHEAGHAICGLAFNWSLTEIWIGKAGRQEPAAIDWDGGITDSWESGVVAAAGVVAEAIHLGASSPADVYWPHPDQPADVRLCRIALACRVVEDRAKVRHPYPDDWICTVIDTLSCDCSCCSEVTNRLPKWEQECIAEAFRILKKTWTDHSRVANGLRTSKTLTLADIQAMGTNISR